MKKIALVPAALLMGFWLAPASAEARAPRPDGSQSLCPTSTSDLDASIKDLDNRISIANNKLCRCDNRSDSKSRFNCSEEAGREIAFLKNARKAAADMKPFQEASQAVSGTHCGGSKKKKKKCKKVKNAELARIQREMDARAHACGRGEGILNHAFRDFDRENRNLEAAERRLESCNGSDRCSRHASNGLERQYGRALLIVDRYENQMASASGSLPCGPAALDSHASGQRGTAGMRIACFSEAERDACSSGNRLNDFNSRGGSGNGGGGGGGGGAGGSGDVGGLSGFSAPFGAAHALAQKTEQGAPSQKGAASTIEPGLASAPPEQFIPPASASVSYGAPFAFSSPLAAAPSARSGRPRIGGVRVAQKKIKVSRRARRSR